MYVCYELTVLADKIKKVYPPLPKITNPSDLQEKGRRSIINDIQYRLAEIYAILQQEIEDDSLDLTYLEAMEKYPKRMSSLLNTIAILGLCIKTKLNINLTEKLFDDTFINKIDTIGLACYKLKSYLSGKLDSEANSFYSKGVVSELNYEDYKSNFKKKISPGEIKGQLISIYACSPEEQTKHLSLITHIREELDPDYKAPKIEDRLILSYSSSKKPYTPVELRNPKNLLLLSMSVVTKNYDKLFNKLAKLPTTITEKFPELDVDYKHKFICKVKNIIQQISFKPDDKEKEYLQLLEKALKNENPYNAVRQVLGKIDEQNKVGFWSTFKTHMQPIRSEIVELMKNYNTEKNAYGSKIEKSL